MDHYPAMREDTSTAHEKAYVMRELRDAKGSLEVCGNFLFTSGLSLSKRPYPKIKYTLLAMDGLLVIRVKARRLKYNIEVFANGTVGSDYAVSVFGKELEYDSMDCTWSEVRFVERTISKWRPIPKPKKRKKKRNASKKDN